MLFIVEFEFKVKKKKQRENNKVKEEKKNFPLTLKNAFNVLFS